MRWLQQQIANEADEAEAAVFSDEDNAVRLLTIHGSKGLAFPTVIVLDTGSWERPNSAPIGLLRGDHQTSLVIRHVTDAGSLATPLSRRATEDSLARARAEAAAAVVRRLDARAQPASDRASRRQVARDSLAASIVGASARLAEIPGVIRIAAHSLFGEAPFSATPARHAASSATRPAASPARLAGHDRV